MNLSDSKSYCTLVVQTKTIDTIRLDANIKYMYKSFVSMRLRVKMANVISIWCYVNNYWIL